MPIKCLEESSIFTKICVIENDFHMKKNFFHFSQPASDLKKQKSMKLPFFSLNHPCKHFTYDYREPSE